MLQVSGEIEEAAIITGCRVEAYDTCVVSYSGNRV